MSRLSGRKHILITGPPRVGKTTLIISLCQELERYRPAGFYTSEVRRDGIRKGFELVGLGGEKALLSHVDLKSPHRVGKYGVDLRGFEEFLDVIPWNDPSRRLVIIDEIGKMECLSGKFRTLVNACLDSDKVVLASIAQKGDPFMEAMKKRPDVTLVEVSVDNREHMVRGVADLLDAALASSRTE